MSHSIITPKAIKHEMVTLWTHASSPDEVLCQLAIDTCEFANKHMFKNVAKSKLIQVNIDMPAATEDGSIPQGCCVNTVSEGIIPAMVTVTINPFNTTEEEFVDTILHELTHAEQIFEGRLSSSRIRCGENPTVRLWNKKAFSTRLMDYIDWPWEVEARDRAATLTSQFYGMNNVLAAFAEVEAL